MQNSVLAELHRRSVDDLASNGAYKNLSKAKVYCTSALGPLWRNVLGIDDEDDALSDQLGLTPTMTLVLHLFARGVHGHKPSKHIPCIRHWRPVADRDAERLRFPCAVSKRDIAKIIGKGQSAVDDAVSGFRGKRDKYEVLYEKRVVCPLFVETGIMMDVMLSANLSFSFMLDDYNYARRVAEDARLNDAVTNYRQREWCSEAASKIGPTTTPPAKHSDEDESRDAQALS